MIVPVILAGGSGSRLWPLSRESYAKQFLKLGAEQTLLQESLLISSRIASETPIIVTNESQRFLVESQARALGMRGCQILIEPCRRNTAPAIALAAFTAKARDPKSILLILPSDHKFADEQQLRSSLTDSFKLAAKGYIVTLGIHPRHPETGYGYIHKGDQLEEKAFCIQSFKEKPNLELAEKYLQSGDYYWNSGVFIVMADTYLKELQQHAPDVFDTALAAYNKCDTDLSFTRYPEDLFAQAPDLSIDYAIMEKTSKGAMVSFSDDWSDIGSWQSLWAYSDKDSEGNVTFGDVISEESKNNLAFSQSRLVALLGVENTIVIETKDAVLVADMSKSQSVKKLVALLEKQNRLEGKAHREEYRPWGKYDSIDHGERYQVKRITVNPGAKLSVQMHYHRSEHWVVVKGTAKVTCADKTFLLSENESTYIPVGEVHALENPGMVPLELIEVQSGSYLGEDDIVRFEDRYGRLSTIDESQKSLNKPLENLCKK